MAHATQELALGTLERPLLLEVFFVRVDQRRDNIDLCGTVSVGPVEALCVVQGYCAVARLTGAHAKLLVVDDLTSAQGARCCLVPTLLLRLHAVAEHAQWLTLF